MAAETFQTDLPDLQGFIKSLDLLDENVNRSVRENICKGGGVICAEQKRLAESINPKLADAIDLSRVYVTKKGVIGITSGYQADAFKTDADGFNPGIVGSTYEFGRPGGSPGRTKETMKQKRKIRTATKTTKKGKVIKDRTQPAEPKEIDVKKGYIAARPHIRRGFDIKVNEAVQTVIDGVNAEIGKVFNE